jgi:adenylate cyclase
MALEENKASSFYFEGFELDLARGRLVSPEGSEIPLRPKALDLLGVLAANAGRTLTKGELIDRVWGDVHVTEDSLFQAVRDVRRSLDDGSGQLVRSIARRGYILDCAVQTAAVAEPAMANPIAPRELTPNRTSVAILPFKTLGSSGGRDYITDGLVDEIASALSRFRWLFVSATRSTTLLREAECGIAEIGRLLGVRYLVEGSIAYSDRSLRISSRLVEVASERTVWSDRFIGDIDELFRLHDEVTSAIAAALEPRILRAEIERVLRQMTTNLDAFDCYLRALPSYYSRTPSGNIEAIRLLQMAIERDPHFQLARALLARCTATAVWLGTERDHAAGYERALSLARAALAGDRTDPQILAICGHLLAIVGGEHDEAKALLDLSLRINPSDADAWRLGAWVAVWSGESDLALERLDAAEKLDPLSPLQADSHSARAAALFFAKRFGEAAEAARRSLATTPEATAPRRFLIAALAQSGAHDEAATECNELLRRQPTSSISRSRANSPFRHGWMSELFLQGLRRAGLPE